MHPPLARRVRARHGDAERVDVPEEQQHFGLERFDLPANVIVGARQCEGDTDDRVKPLRT